MNPLRWYYRWQRTRHLTRIDAEERRLLVENELAADQAMRLPRKHLASLFEQLTHEEQTEVEAHLRHQVQLVAGMVAASADAARDRIRAKYPVED